MVLEMEMISGGCSSTRSQGDCTTSPLLRRHTDSLFSGCQVLACVMETGDFGSFRLRLAVGGDAFDGYVTRSVDFACIPHCSTRRAHSSAR